MKKGELTKRDIIEATLRVIASQGVHGTTFRAVADEANVKLSLVGYHFPDRAVLLRNSVAILFGRQSGLINNVFNEIFSLIAKFNQRDFRRSISRAEIALLLSDAVTDVIYNYYLSDRVDPKVLLNLKFDIHPDPALIHVRNLGHRSLKAYLIELCQKIHSDSPVDDSRLLAGVFTLFELECLQQRRPDYRKIHNAVWQCFSHILNVSGSLHEVSERVKRHKMTSYDALLDHDDLFSSL